MFAVLVGSKALRRLLACAVVAVFFAVTPMAGRAQAVVDASTLNKKIMAGYQGWFMTGNDGSGAGWRHWSSKRSTPNASTVTVDMWPDLREYAASELTPTSFKYANDKTAGLYSAYNTATVTRHVKWMKDYGIDGVFVQRFVVEAVGMRSVRDKVLQNVRAGAETHGRVFANMYDISGANSSSLVADIKNDWMHLVDNQKITASRRYLRHEGKPVVSIWGFGVSDRPGSASELQSLINWFKTGAADKYRATVMLGVDPNWRSHSSSWQTAYRSVAVISPWTVGRYRDDAGADKWRDSKITPDLNALSGSGTDYMPVVFPGFSWGNLKNTSFNEIPRRGGRFFWRQAHNAIQAGAKMVYVAMFDEVDEGTAMFKMAETKAQLPTTGQFVPLNVDGENIPSDWYLRLMGQATRMLRGERALSPVMPAVPGIRPKAGESDGLDTDQTLSVNGTIWSANGSYWFVLQGDGNLVVYRKGGRVIWASGTVGKGGVTLQMRGDGNLVLSNAKGRAVWATGTNGTGAVELVMQNDGILVLKTRQGAVVWNPMRKFCSTCG